MGHLCVGKPISPTIRFVLVRTVIGKVRATAFIAAIKRGRKAIGDIEFFRLHTGKKDFFDNRKECDGDGNGKVRNHAANSVVAAKGRVLDTS